MNREQILTSRRQIKRNVLSSFVFLTLAITSFLTATESLAKNYTFTWTANAEPVEGYKLYYKKDGAATQPFGGTGAAEGVSPIYVGKVTTFTVTGLDENSTYHFALTATNGSEESGYSDIVTVSPDRPSPQLIQIRVL